jgi:2-methylisocitrate lyase-like PEP mutase family enzyme
MPTSSSTAGARFRRRVATGRILPLIGVYDVFSAKLAAARFEGVFCSGFSFAASAYGLPDVGYVNWRDMLDFATKIRHILPRTHILVDIDDGFGDEIVAVNTVRNLEHNGLSAVIMEDQKRPRRCGHFKGKELLPVEEYEVKLRSVLKSRRSIFVIARTDATDVHEGIARAERYAALGADAVMIEAIRDLSTVRAVSRRVKCPVVVNQLRGGKSPDWNLRDLQKAGASIVIYSTPCLFAAQHAIQNYLDQMRKGHGLPTRGTVAMRECVQTLETSGQ